MSDNPATELYQALGQLPHDYPVLPGMDKMLDKALAAANQIEELQAHAQRLKVFIEQRALPAFCLAKADHPLSVTIGMDLTEAKQLLDETPSVSLAEVRALAARNGFIAGADWGHAAERLDPGVMSAANHYSNCIRQGAKS